MKKLAFTIAAIAALTQASFAQLAIAPEVGGLFSNYPGKDMGEKFDSKALFGMRAGAIVDIGLSNNFYLQPGILYVRNGYTFDNVISSGTIKVNSMEIPLNVQYKFGSAGGDRFFVGVGPYLAFNLGGKADGTAYGMSTTANLQIGNDAQTDNIKAFDFGAGLNLGYELSNGLYIRAHYQHGFVNLFPGGNTNNSSYSTNYGLSVGYLFATSGHAKKKMTK